MNDWFVDSNVVAKWVLAEPDSPQALRVVSETAAKGGHLYALDLAPIEVANVIRTHFHRGMLTGAEAEQAFTLLETAPVRIVPGLPSLRDAFQLALQFGVPSTTRCSSRRRGYRESAASRRTNRS